MRIQLHNYRHDVTSPICYLIWATSKMLLSKHVWYLAIFGICDEISESIMKQSFQGTMMLLWEIELSDCSPNSTTWTWASRVNRYPSVSAPGPLTCRGKNTYLLGMHVNPTCNANCLQYILTIVIFSIDFVYFFYKLEPDVTWQKEHSSPPSLLRLWICQYREDVKRSGSLVDSSVREELTESPWSSTSESESRPRHLRSCGFCTVFFESCMVLCLVSRNLPLVRVIWRGFVSVQDSMQAVGFSSSSNLWCTETWRR